MFPLPLSLELKAAGCLLAVAGIVGAVAWAAHHERQIGAANVQSKWDAQKLIDEQAAEAQRESQRLRAQAAASTYEAQRAAIAARLTKPSPEVANALHAPICPPQPGVPGRLELGDVPIPAAVLQRLRDAGADY